MSSIRIVRLGQRFKSNGGATDYAEHMPECSVSELEQQHILLHRYLNEFVSLSQASPLLTFQISPSDPYYQAIINSTGNLTDFITSVAVVGAGAVEKMQKGEKSENLAAKLPILGGIISQYMPNGNFGLIHSLTLSDPSRDTSVGIQLLRDAVKRLRHRAIMNGYSTCAGIFTASGEKHIAKCEDVLNQLGFAKIVPYGSKVPPLPFTLKLASGEHWQVLLFQGIPNSHIPVSSPKHSYFAGGDTFRNASNPLSFPIISNESEFYFSGTKYSGKLFIQFISNLWTSRFGSEVLVRDSSLASWLESSKVYQMGDPQIRLQKSYKAALPLPLTPASNSFKANHSGDHVVVVGAGLAGLSAVESLLSEAKRIGFPLTVTLVEASERLGGRVRQSRELVDRPIDIGGEFIHGSHNNSILDVAFEQNLSVECVFRYDHPENNAEYKGHQMRLSKIVRNSECDPRQLQDRLVFYWKGKLVPAINSNDPDIAKAHSIAEEMALLAEDAANGKMDTPNTRRLQKLTVREFARSLGANDAVIQLLDAILTQTAAAKWTDHGALETGREDNVWDHGRDNFRMDKSFEPVLNHLHAKIKDQAQVAVNWQVKHVQRQSSGKKIRLLNQNGEHLEASHVIFTVPLAIYRDGDIEFEPPLPPEKIRSFWDIGIYSATKIMLRVRRRFWKGQIGVILAPGKFVQQIWLNTLPSPANSVSTCSNDGCGADEQIVITGYASGDLAANIHLMETTEEIVARFAQQMDEMFASADNVTPVSSLVTRAHVYQWLDNPHVRCGYSCNTVTTSKAAREAFIAPVDGKIFFAGEAAAVNATACIQHARDSGIKAAKDVLLAICNVHRSNSHPSSSPHHSSHLPKVVSKL